MTSTRWWLAVPLAVGLAVAACDGDGGGAGESEAGETDAPVATAAATPDTGEATEQVMTLDGEEIPVESVRCFFEEQPRAGLGGVFTHTAQASGTNADGEPVTLDLSRARGEDDVVGDNVIVDIGDPFADDSFSLTAGGPEGLLEFGEASVSADGVEVTRVGADPVALSFDLACS